MKLEDVIHKLEADRAYLQNRLAFYTSISPENWPNIIMAILEGELMKTQEVIYLLLLASTSGVL